MKEKLDERFMLLRAPFSSRPRDSVSLPRKRTFFSNSLLPVLGRRVGVLLATQVMLPLPPQP